MYKYVLLVLKNLGLQRLRTFGFLDPIRCHQLFKKGSSIKIKACNVACGTSIMSGESYLINSCKSSVLLQYCLCSVPAQFFLGDQQNYNLAKS